ncbi:MAG: VOC family protein [Gemmatimonadales bacterium]
MTVQGSPFVWYELLTTNTLAAQEFYGAVIGWTAAPFPGNDMSYTIFSANGNGAAGMMALPQEACDAGARPGWMGYIATADVDAATAKLTAAGGTVHRAAEDVPMVGRFAVVADPQGAVFTLIAPASESEAPLVPPMTAGHGAWHELMTTNWSEAFDFYAAQFGWTKAEAMDMGKMGIYQLFGAGGLPIGGMMNNPPEVPTPYWLYYFSVAALDPAIKEVKSRGGKIIVDPMQVPGDAWIVQCEDPQGALFALVSMQR